jgi:hypothetical protein
MKFILLIVAAALLCFSLMIQAASKLVKAPALFQNGPAAITAIKLESHEITSLMLLESISDIASSAVLANGCQSATGSYSFEISADGAINKPENNIVNISSPGNSEPLILNATLEATDSFSFLGQKSNIHQTKNGKLKETLIQEYFSAATVNREFSLLSMQSHVNVSGQNNTLIPHQNILLKHFYEEPTADQQKQYILGWGSASSSRSDYPVNLDWIRFKALKTNGQLKRVVIQKDQLIGSLTCRILIDTAKELIKDNEKEIQKKVVLKGVMTITVPLNYEDNPLALEF